MNIAVIGTGNVGKTLGGRLAEAGHNVVYGARNPEGNEKSIKEAAESAEVILLAVPYTAIEDVAKEISPLKNQVIVDAINAVKPTFDGLGPKLDSVSEELTQLTGSTRIVKCFNTVGFNVMADPNFNGQKASMLYCGDDEQAKKAVALLAADIGFAPEDAGPLLQAKNLENFAWLWITVAMKYGHGVNMAFILNKK